MNQQLATNDNQVIERLVLDGDLSKMNEKQKVSYYLAFCRALALSPITQPFKIIKFQGREIMYATKDCSEQLRNRDDIAITDLTGELRGTVYIVTAKARNRAGKTDIATGAVNIEGLKGELLSNAYMKAETKAKRRVTLSICGLSVPDESEIQSFAPEAVEVSITIPADTKVPLTDKAFATAMDRIQAGEKDLITKLKETCLLTQVQSDTLLALEDKA